MASPWCSRARDISGIDSALDRAGCVAFRRSTRRFDHAACRGCNDVELALRMLQAGLLQNLASAVMADDGGEYMVLDCYTCAGCDRRLMPALVLSRPKFGIAAKCRDVPLATERSAAKSVLIRSPRRRGRATWLALQGR